jgi:hypothetical protein
VPRGGRASVAKKKAKQRDPGSDEDESSEEESSSEEASSAEEESDGDSDVSDDPDGGGRSQGAAPVGAGGGKFGNGAGLGGPGGGAGNDAGTTGKESIFSTRLSSVRRQAFKVSQRSGIDHRKLRMIRMDALQDSDLIRMEALVDHLLGERVQKSSDPGKNGGTKNHSTVMNYSLLRQKLRASIAAPTKGALAKKMLHRGGGVDGRKAELAKNKGFR